MFSQTVLAAVRKWWNRRSRSKARGLAFKPKVEGLEDRSVPTVYSFESLVDPATLNQEYRLRANGYHFLTVLETPNGTVQDRGRPDLFSPDGFGATQQWNIFIAGSGVDATQGQIDSVAVVQNGIQITAHGNVPSPAGNAGTWTEGATVNYDFATQRATLVGTLTVDLFSSLTGDLNIGRIQSNFLHQYVTNVGTTANTGDLSFAEFFYGADSPVPHHAWTPAPGQEGFFPTDASSDVTAIAHGQINQSDPNVTEIRKPTLERRVVSTNPATKLIAGGFWDSTQVGFQFDNVGISQIVRPQNANAVTFEFQVTSVWSVPPLPNYPVVLEAETMQVAPASAGTIQGGVLHLRFNGRASGLRFVDPGVYRLDVVARGVHASGVFPRMQIDVNGRAVGAILVRNQFKPYVFVAEIDGGPTTMGIRYLNDFGVRALVIDKVIITPLGDLPDTRTVIPGAAMTIIPPAAGAIQGSLVKLSSTGFALATQDLDAGVYRIEVTARGKSAGRVLPRMQVSINGFAISRPIKVPASNATFYSYVFGNFSLSGSTTFGVRLLNGPRGRQLFIERIILRRM